MAKPASSRCNLDCRYCFYIEKPTQPTMDDATLETFIRQHIAAQPGSEVMFAWQGGEPTLCGIDFFAAWWRCKNSTEKGSKSITLSRPTEFCSMTNGVSFYAITAGWLGFPGWPGRVA